MKTRTSPRSETSPKAGLMLGVLAVAVLVAVPSAQAAIVHKMELVGDNVDINVATNWYETSQSGSGGHVYRAELNLGRTGYLDSTYTDGSTKPQLNQNWYINAGHFDLRNGATLSKTGGVLEIKGTGGDESAATVTLNPGASFASPGVYIAHNDGFAATFIVNNGGTVVATTNIALGTWGTDASDGNTRTGVGVFKVIGDGGTIGADDFSISKNSKAVFELDGTGISTIQVGDELKIWDDGSGNPAGILSVDTSARGVGQYTVDLFTYGSLSGTFGTVQILYGGDLLTPGTGTVKGTYNLDYTAGTGNKTVRLTYYSPEPATLALMGLGGLGLVLGRKRR